MTQLNDYVALANGLRLPRLGVSTYQVAPVDQVARIEASLHSGFRRLDLGSSQRLDVDLNTLLTQVDGELLTSIKLEVGGAPIEVQWQRVAHTYGAGRLQIVFLHMNCQDEIDSRWLLRQWQALEKLYFSHQLKAIGVCNFSLSAVEQLVAQAEVHPQIAQIAYFLGCASVPLMAFLRQHRIQIETYTPVATQRLQSQPEITILARRYSVTVAALIAQYCIQKGMTVLIHPTVNQSIGSEGLGFVVSEAEMAQLDRLSTCRCFWS